MGLCAGFLGGISFIAAAAGLTASADAGLILFSVHNQNAINRWDSATQAVTLFHTQLSNDVDYNPSEGSTYAWLAEHNGDSFARFVPGSGTGVDQNYQLGTGGRTHYDYPKHITVFNGAVMVMSRNTHTVFRYDQNGNQLGSFIVGNASSVGQGMATDGNNLFVSIWNGSVSSVERYDGSFALTGTFANPTGMGAFNNMVDFAYDAATGRFFGIATTGENGTSLNTNAVREFNMGGAVVASYTLPFQTDGVGQIPEPAGAALLAVAAAAAATRRRVRPRR